MADEIIYPNQPNLSQANTDQAAQEAKSAKQNVLAYSQNQAPPPPEKKKPKSLIKKLLIVGIVIFLIFVALLFILFFFSSKDREKVVNKEDRVELTYWGLWEDESIPASIISGFEAENPNIKVTYEYHSPEEYKEKLLARVPIGNGPDIFRFHISWYDGISTLLAPLTTDVIEKEDFENKYYEVAKRDLIKNGAVYGIPMEIDTLALFINPAIVDQVESESEKENFEIKDPKTWRSFVEVSKLLTKRDDQGKIVVGGAGIGTYDNIYNAPDIISLLFAQNRVDLTDFPSADQDRISGALRYYTNFVLVENNVWAPNIDSALKTFTDGNLAMYFGYAKDYQKIKKTNPNFTFRVIPVPQLFSEEKFNIANYFAEGVSLTSLHQKEAMKFMEYLTRPETQQRLFDAQVKINAAGIPPADKSLAPKLTGTDLYVFVDQTNTAFSSPFAVTIDENSPNEEPNLYLKNAVVSILDGGISDDVISDLMQNFTTGGIDINIPDGQNVIDAEIPEF